MSHERAPCATCPTGTRIAGAMGWPDMMCARCWAAAAAIEAACSWLCVLPTLRRVRQLREIAAWDRAALEDR